VLPLDPGLVPLAYAGLAGAVAAAIAVGWALRRERRRRRVAERIGQQAQARLRSLSSGLHEAVVTYDRDRQIGFV